MAILFNAGRFKATDKSNLPIPGAFLSFYATLTSTPQPVYSDSALSILLTNPVKADANGLFPEIWLDDSLPPYKVVFASPDANNANIPGSTIWSIAQYNASFSVGALLPLLNPATDAELLAGVTPVNYAYPPGDLRRYGATVNSDVTAALQAAIAQQQIGGAPVYVPTSMGALTIGSGVTLTAPLRMQGDIYGGSRISASSDMTMLTFTLAASGSYLSDLQFVGADLGTAPALLLSDSNNNTFENIMVTKFGVGVKMQGGGTGNNSSFSNTLDGCRIFGNVLKNIHAEANTNALMLKNCTFGGGSPVGLYLLDSNTLTIIGGDVEGCSICAVDLDATSTLPAGHLIHGLHIEGNNSTAGDIRIGNTATVQGVSIVASFYPGSSPTPVAGVNAVNCDGLFVRYLLGSGYGSVPFLMKTDLTNEDVSPIGPTTSGLNYRQNNAKFNYADQSDIGFAAATAFDSAYQDSAHFNQYRIKSGSVTAAKDYYAGLDAIEMTNSGSAGAGAKLYARGCIAANDVGGSTKVGAIFAKGDVDISGGRLAPPKDDGTVQSGAVYQGNGVPSNSNGQNGDVYFRTDTPGSANQRIYVKSAGSWVGIA